MFGKLAKHENEMKRLIDREVKSKKKEKFKEEKQNIYLKATSSKGNKSKEESNNSEEEFSEKGRNEFIRQTLQ